MDWQNFLQLVLSGITIGSIYAFIGIGFNIIYNTTSIINFAQGEFVMLGGLILYSFHQTLHIPLIPAILLTLILVTLIGIGMERLTLHPVKNPTVLNMIIITIGCSIFLKGVALSIWGREVYHLPFFFPRPPFQIGGASITTQSLVVWIALILSSAFLYFFYRFTLLGKAMRACSVNPVAARLMGIKVKSLVTLSFALAAFLGGLAGVTITPISLMDYQRGSLLALKGFAAAVLGGLGKEFGAILAGMALGITESLVAGYISSGYKDAVSLLILLFILFVRPGGIMGSKEEISLREL
ncbi:MAG TPA: branched-chain amino acid ABC transporter permease [bacterium]|nr:branched-chain amino acid ABC transporter permease [bacterium]HEX68251.1 branched-chain amino acid ABC transporter permease [bacterium]